MCLAPGCNAVPTTEPLPIYFDLRLIPMSLVCVQTVMTQIVQDMFEKLLTVYALTVSNFSVMLCLI